MRLAYRGVSAGNVLQVRLRDNVALGNLVDVGGPSADYTLVDIPLNTLNVGVNLNAITEIDINVGGAAQGTGNVYIDAIEFVNKSNFLIYKGGYTRITGTWSSKLSEITSENPFEGGQHYKFSNYDLAGIWWDGFGLNLNNFGSSPPLDFSGKTHLRFAYKGVSAGNVLQVSLRDNNTIGTLMNVGELSADYTLVNVPINLLGSGLDLSAITEIDFSVGGAAQGTGNVYIDAIELIDSVSQGGSMTLARSRAAQMGLGVNMANWLEAGWLLQFGSFPETTAYTKEDIEGLANCGFKTIRLPIIFQSISLNEPPYTLQTSHPMYQLIDSMIVWTDMYNLKLIIDNHHAEPKLTNANYLTEIPHIKAIWEQIIARYGHLDPNRVFFEIYNEPTDAILNNNLKVVYNAVISAIRAAGSNHTLIVGGAGWNAADQLPILGTLPDTNLIYTFHNYTPMKFTHQGFPWYNNGSSITGVPFPDTINDVAQLRSEFNLVNNWANSNNVPIFLGEFGVGTNADSISRCNWIKTVGNILDTLKIPACYWDVKNMVNAFGFFENGIVSGQNVWSCFADALHLNCSNTVPPDCSPDVTAPTISACPSNISLTTSTSSAVATWTAPTATDNCSPAPMVTGSHTSGSNFPLGTTTVVYTAKDAANNTKTCSFNIVVSSSGGGSTCANNLLQNASFESNLTSWTGSGGTIVTSGAHSGNNALRLCAAGAKMRQTVSVQVGKTYTFSGFAKADVGKSASLRIKYLNSSFAPISQQSANIVASTSYIPVSVSMLAPLGAAFAELTIISSNATGCVTVDALCFSEEGSTPPPTGCSPDVTAPMLSACPSNISLTTTTTSAVATWSAPTATDNCSPAPVVTGSHASGSNFPLGTTTVVYTAKDAANNTKTCSFNIVVSSLGGGSTCANNLLQNASFESNLTSWTGSGGTIVTSGAHSGNNALRLCAAGAKMRQTVSVQVGKTYTFRGFAKADVGKSASLRIKYLNSSFAPISQQSVNIVASTSYIPVSVSMLAPLGTAFAELTIISSNATGCVTADALCFSEEGSTPPPTGCSPDLTAPSLSNCPSNTLLTTTTSSAVATWTAPTATDNCSPAPVVTGSHASGSSFPIGTTTVVYTAKDAANNTKTCSFAVTVSSQGATNYCTSTSASPWAEYISSVKVGNTVKTSGKSVYSDFTGTSFLMGKAAANALELQATYSFTTYDEYWKVWIDYNRNNVFEEPSEVVLQQVMTKPASATGVKKVLQASINVPSTAINGTTRMRVSMKRGSYATPCETLPYGEVEDYTVQIASSVLYVQPQDIHPSEGEEAELPDFVLYPNPAGEYVRVMLKPWKGNEAELSIINQLGVEVVSKAADLSQSAEVEFDLSQFTNGMYFVKLSCAGYRDVYKKLMVGRGY